MSSEPIHTDELDTDFLTEESTGKKEIFRPNPMLLVQIIATTSTVLKENADTSELEALYLTVKQFVNQITKDSDTLSVVFAYYIESHRGYSLYKQNMESEEPVTPDHRVLYNNAALSLFDLYLRRPQDVVVRRLLPVAAVALHEIITIHASRPKADEDMGVVLGHLSTVALLSQTLRVYLKGETRTKNYEYITWLKNFLNRAVNTDDLSFFDDDETLKKVMKQLMNNEPSITV